MGGAWADSSVAAYDGQNGRLAPTTGADFSVMERLLEVLATPYDHGRDLPTFNAPRLRGRFGGQAGSGDAPYRTFCGT